MSKKYFSLAFVFSLVTAIYSLTIAYKTHGSIFATVSSDEILQYGGAIDGATLKAGEWWRIFSSQLVHSKQWHMLFNVLMTWTVGSALERKLGSLKFTTIYWLGGFIGI